MTNRILEAHLDRIELDGSLGEGGGQILRSALTLSIITGQPFSIERIRAKRPKPGLLRQHLTAVQAAAGICGARVEGDHVGSPTLHFQPGAIMSGNYEFAIGTAGSCTLVLQTILPALWFAPGPSSVTVTGGTHNKAAPPADFLIRAWSPLIGQMGVDQSISLERHGFYPAGGGRISASVRPCRSLRPISLLERGSRRSHRALALVAALPAGIAARELARAATHFPEIEQEERHLRDEEGPGNAFLIEIAHEFVTELFTGFGERGLAAETVVDHAAKQARQYLASCAAVGEHLADQLLLPMALARGGEFTTCAISSHFETNVSVIEKFLPVEFGVDILDARVTRVSLR